MAQNGAKMELFGDNFGPFWLQKRAGELRPARFFAEACFLMQKWSEMATKCAPRAPKMTPKAPKMVPKAPKSDPQMAEMVPK